jgi:serine/threonine protein kinase
LLGSQGTIVGFGQDTLLQLGRNQDLPPLFATLPVRVDTSLLSKSAEMDETAVWISAGLSSSLFVTNMGNVFTFGSVCMGGVVLGRTGCAKLPAPVLFGLGSQNVTMAVLGGFHTIALSSGNKSTAASANATATATVALPAECLAGDNPESCARSGQFTTSQMSPPLPPVASPPQESSTPNGTDGLLLVIWVAVACAVAVCVLVGLALVVWYRRRLARADPERAALNNNDKHGQNTQTTRSSRSSSDDYDVLQLMEYKSSPSTGRPSADGDGQDHKHSHSHSRRSAVAIQQIDIDDVEFQSVLGKGNFGVVWKCVWDDVDVACKAVVSAGAISEGHLQKMRAEVINEARLLKKLSHPHCVQFLGVVFGPEDPLDDTSAEAPWFVLEYMPGGSLLTVLRKNPESLPQVDRIGVLSHLASGMNYLHKRDVVHRDLACRNILMKRTGDSGWTAKLSDFGLSRAVVGEENVYQATSGSEMPVRWAAIESLRFREFGRPSDVWQFSIMAVEALSGGAVPYEHLSNKQVVDAVVNQGERPARPVSNASGSVDVPDGVWDLLTRCWAAKPDQRPNFKEVHAVLREEVTALLGERSTSDNSTESSAASSPRRSESGDYQAPDADGDANDFYQNQPASATDDYQTTT